MPVERHHSHSETHNGFVPESQLADGTATAGFVVTATGTGEAEWAEGGGGGGGCDCCHEHARERFVALGDSPEVFTLSAEPLADTIVDVFLGSPSPIAMVDPDIVTVTGSDVELDTTTDDVVIIEYERECLPPQAPPVEGGTGFLSVPGANETHNGRNNILASFTTTGPSFLVVDIGTALNATGTQVFGVTSDTTNILNFSGSSIPVGRYLFALQEADTYYIYCWTGSMGTYTAGLTGAGDFAFYYPAGSGVALNYPGTSDTIFSDPCNRLRSFSTAQAGLFITIVDEFDPDPADWSLAVADVAEGDTGFWTGPVAAGTYVFCPIGLVSSDPPALYRILAQKADLAYHGDLAGSGYYELHPAALLP